MAGSQVVGFAAIVTAGALFVPALQTAVDHPAVQVRWTDKGPASIQFAGREYLSFGEFTLSRLSLVDSKHNPQPASLQATVRVDPELQTARLFYPWGSIQSRITAVRNVLAINIEISNTSPWRIDGLALEPLRLRFDQKPLQYDGSIPVLADNITNPGVLVMTTSDESVVLANEDPTKPLSIGFPWALNKPANTEFPIRVMTGPEPMYPDRTPIINRPILAGQKDTYNLSLTFGAPDQVNDLASTIYHRLARLYPSIIDWTDRRPIGAIMLATADAGFPANPRGWFLDRSLDIFGERGRASFRQELMRWADTSIGILHEMNAQGAVTWDIEGEQYPHPSTYVGDPRLIDTLDPEMSSCVDDYFKRFRDAGLRVGLTIRPQQFLRSSDGRNATQQAVTDPIQLLTDKIRYARQRWGATLFYVDSNGDPNYPMDSNVFRTVAKDNPGILLIPEHSSLLYYAFSAPYAELRKGVTASPSLARSLYPNAFTVINTADGPLREKLPELREAAQRGDVLMFRTWFQDPANALVRAVTRDATKHGGWPFRFTRETSSSHYRIDPQ